MESLDYKYYMIRAMTQSDEDFTLFFEKGIVAVGWSEINFSAFTKPDRVKELIEKVRNKYYSDRNIAPQYVGKKLNEVYRFKNIKKGDRLLIPYYSEFRMAKALEEEIYDPEAGESHDMANQRRVEYRKFDGKFIAIPRQKLSEGLQRRLRVRGTTISDLAEFKQELNGIWNISDDEIATGKCGWDQNYLEKQEEIENNFKETLLKRLRSGQTNLQAGGIGLEHLVKELLEIAGYQADVLPKSEFPGIADADVSATKPDPIYGEMKLFVQVKHHDGTSDDWGARQLIDIREKTPEIARDRKLVFITTGDITEAAMKFCDSYDIAVLSGREFVDWLSNEVKNLNPQTKMKLGLSDTPQFISLKKTE